jgi:hypothetical protein
VLTSLMCCSGQNQHRLHCLRRISCSRTVAPAERYAVRQDRRAVTSRSLRPRAESGRQAGIRPRGSSAHRHSHRCLLRPTECPDCRLPKRPVKETPHPIPRLRDGIQDEERLGALADHTPCTRAHDPHVARSRARPVDITWRDKPCSTCWGQAGSALIITQGRRAATA